MFRLHHAERFATAHAAPAPAPPLEFQFGQIHSIGVVSAISDPAGQAAELL